MAIIRTQNLTKRFKDLVAVDSVNLEINEGECFGLLGPNGAGKTTLIRMITAVSPANSGDIQVMGLNVRERPREVKAKMGVAPQQDNLDPDLTVLENLVTFARYFEIPKKKARERSLEILHFFELEEKRNSRIDQLSGGMKRRLIIARSLINQPGIIVLDEPTTGLDPHAKHLVWQKLTDLKSQGITQILCTQNMEEAAYLCDRVGIMDLGKILSVDSPQNLVACFGTGTVWEISLNSEDKDKVSGGLKSRGLEFRDTGGKFSVFDTEDEAFLLGLLNSPQNLKRRTANLEDVFLKLTGRSLEE